ncbi:hypothetical protein LXA26_18105, partial [Erwinia amylovora]|uniref:hypothetical protein n=1 Tax=Erwinia amylovora TaxID=552 RepID=UPI0020BD860D
AIISITPPVASFFTIFFRNRFITGSAEYPDDVVRITDRLRVKAVQKKQFISYKNIDMDDLFIAGKERLKQNNEPARKLMPPGAPWSIASLPCT